MGFSASFGDWFDKMENGLPKRHCHILLVEDEPLLLMSLSDMLRELGHDVVEVVDGPTALAHLRAHADTDVLITDINMPCMDGIELANKAREVVPGIPVIFSSGYSAEKVPHLNIGPRTCFLQKPFGPEAMERALSKLTHPMLIR